MPTLGPKTFQNQPLSDETRRRLDALQDQVNKLSTSEEKPAERSRVRQWRKTHPGAVLGGGLRKA